MRYTDEELADRSLTGEFDTDNGGRDPAIRLELRKVLQDGLMPIEDWTWKEYQFLTRSDARALVTVALAILNQAWRLLGVRDRQSNSNRKRGLA